ncbi:MAG: hypothetical protein KZQ78_06920, partial [Candidatus Thiodiazotropha sp. (ex Ustalcina ferruginea)]|nr:hypothetical protein [Candidatus Thiodiazotropha sp. (ex Ustalcina ferruginea)]
SGAITGCRRSSRFRGLGSPEIHHEIKDSLEPLRDSGYLPGPYACRGLPTFASLSRVGSESIAQMVDSIAAWIDATFVVYTGSPSELTATGAVLEIKLLRSSDRVHFVPCTYNVSLF